MTTPLDTVQSVDFKMLDYGETHKNENGECEPISFSMKTTTQDFSLLLSVGKGDTHPYVRVFENGKPIMGIFHDYWSIDYEFNECCVEEDFPQLVNEYFSNFIGYSVSKCVVKPIVINGRTYPHCLRIELTKETDSGIDTRILSIVPSFSPCSFCGADKQINVLYKCGDATINELLIALDESANPVLTGKQGKPGKKKVKKPRIVDAGDGWFEVSKK